MGLQKLWQWLKQPATDTNAMDYTAKAQSFMRAYNGSDGERRMKAEWRLRRMAYGWEGEYEAAHVIAILKQIEQSRNLRALNEVELLANAKTRTETHRQVKEAAQACLAALQAKIKEDAVRETSLRASEAPPAPADTLLRPAQSGTSTLPEELLRAEQGNDFEKGQGTRAS